MKNYLSTSNDIENSRPFDVHVWSDYPEFNQLVHKLWVKYFPLEDGIVRRGPVPKAITKVHFKTLLLDLYVSWMTDPNMYLGIFMAKSAWKPNSRYNALHLSFRMVAIIKELEAVGLVEVELGRQGTLTRIRATRQLQLMFRDLKFPIRDVAFGYMEETIILRAAPKKSDESDEKDARKTKKKPKKPNLEYVDTPETIRMRGVLKKYNELLGKSRLDVFSLDVPYVVRNTEKGKRAGDTARLHIDDRNTFVKRVFNNASWESGGRFYGGWWQQIGKELRSDIMINDNPVVEIDFNAMHIALLQAQVVEKPEPDLVVVKGGEPQQKPDLFEQFSAARLIATDDAPNANDDPYTLGKTIFPYKMDFDQRKAVKKLVLMAINADSRALAFSAFRSSQPSGDPLRKMTNAELSQLLDAFIEKHPKLEPFLCAVKWGELMYLDSRIAESVIEQLTDKSIPVLCVHDSFIVADYQKKELLRAMERACNQVIGRSIASDYTKQGHADWFEEANRTRKTPKWRLKKIVRCEGYLRRMGLNPYDEFHEWIS
ncbi:hypothetical protein N9491_07350 [Planktomarina temperata]|nr:hypothetical protein [Planktomarina temperata]